MTAFSMETVADFFALEAKDSTVDLGNVLFNEFNLELPMDSSFGDDLTTSAAENANCITSCRRDEEIARREGRTDEAEDLRIRTEILKISIKIQDNIGVVFPIESFHKEEYKGDAEALLILELALVRAAIQEVVPADLLNQQPDLIMYVLEKMVGKV